MKKSQYSIIIIGSGIAGLLAALELSNNHKKILIVSKTTLDDGSSKYAQGGIASVLPFNIEDSIDKHVNDTIKAGAGLSDFKIAETISKEGSTAINKLLEYGVEFDKETTGDFCLTLEGAHSAKRILHAGGDTTGKSIVETLIKEVKKGSNIEIKENTQAVELLMDSKHHCKGVVLFDSKEHEAAFAPFTVLATGGYGQVFSNTTNPKVSTGDGIALAYKAGAIVQNMEFIQFHPTAFAFESEGTKFLISEAVRGEGAKLKNSQGTFFAKNYNPLADLAPRDIVARSIFFEMKKTEKDFVQLDTTLINSEKILKRFPSIAKKCKDVGIDITKEAIPVSPSAHYAMGGVSAQIDGSTGIQGLFAIGETACTGFHGANRLASNSLLECAVMPVFLAKKLMATHFQEVDKEDFKINENINAYSQDLFISNKNADSLIKKLQESMWENVSIIRSEYSLKKALADIENIKNEVGESFCTQKCLSVREYELRNLIIISELVVQSALARQESRGSHYREDYPDSLKDVNHSLIKKGKILKNAVPST